MSNYELVDEATRNDFDRQLGAHPITGHVLSGDMERAQYISYLRETYHMVRHTPRMLALAAARCEDDRRGLRNWFIEQTEEENNHDLFCIKDIKHLGEDPAVVLASEPMSGAWSLVTQNYFMGTYGNPAGILGVASITEGLGATTAGSMADVLVQHYGYRADTVTFLRSHSGFDAKHFDETKAAINCLVSSKEDLDAVVHGRRMTIGAYALMLHQCLQFPYGAQERASEPAMVDLQLVAAE